MGNDADKVDRIHARAFRRIYFALAGAQGDADLYSKVQYIIWQTAHEESGDPVPESPTEWPELIR